MSSAALFDPTEGELDVEGDERLMPGLCTGWIGEVSGDERRIAMPWKEKAVAAEG